MTPQDTKEFRDASDLQLLLHALGYPNGDEAPGIALVAGAREELGALHTLMEISQPGAEVNLADIGGTIEQIANRLDVALELLDREHRTAEDIDVRLERALKKLEAVVQRREGQQSKQETPVKDDGCV